MKAKKSAGTAAHGEDIGVSTADDTVEEDSDHETEMEAQQGHDSSIKAWSSTSKEYTRNDKVRWEDQTWICRKSHTSDEHWTPAKAYSLWKTGS